MSDFKILKLSSKVQLGREVFKFASPFATVAGFAVSIYGAIQDQKRHEQIVAMLNELKSEIRETRRAIIAKIDDTVLKELSGEAFGLSQGFADYGAVNTIGLLDNLLSLSARLRERMESYLEDPNNSDVYKSTFGPPYALVATVRIAILGAYKDRGQGDAKEISALIRQQRDDAYQFGVELHRHFKQLNERRYGPVAVQDVNALEPNSPILLIGYEFDGSFQDLGSPREVSRQRVYELRAAAIERTLTAAWEPFEKLYSSIKAIK